MSNEPIIVVYGTPAEGVSRPVSFAEGDVFIVATDDLMNAPEDVAASYREFVETRGTTLTDLVLVQEDRTGSIPQDMIDAMHGEVLRIQDEMKRGPHFTVVLDKEINDAIWPARTYLPRKDKDWQQNQKRGRMKPRR